MFGSSAASAERQFGVCVWLVSIAFGAWRPVEGRAGSNAEEDSRLVPDLERVDNGDLMACSGVRPDGRP
jgi:hypothetical protein